ncbi:NitT/TauT family transport system substrate-binding protein [Geodermatophilus bullaregiensis]|uniref:ABC transporter substrate-binding protein n=1 Tax=Geodermatophilus bullaregiensis TaxID=1564160 RepID=UPI00195788D3|nr:ABC transporter substrate-binding protein [Geodermatophilus bullaregiensis]MBM7808028.1 NitT/TauT family transport system substrate-binding protein [Geodermatophilus bullaregiensis]
MTTKTWCLARALVVGTALLPLVLAPLLLTGCSSAEDDQSARELREIQFVLDFSPQGRHAPFYLAQANGHYRDEGLDVTFLRGEGDLFAAQIVAGGKATLGSAMPVTIIEARSQGVPIKSVMVYEHRSPLSYAVWSDSGINSPADFAGRRYGGNPFGSANKVLPAFLRAQGVDPSTIEMQTVDPSALVASFLAGQFDIAPAFHDATWPVYQVKGAEVGRTPREFLLSDWGFDLLGYSVFATDSTIDSDPDLIESFVRATINGYEDTASDPQRAVNAILEQEPTLDETLLRAQVDNALELMKSDRYGYASPEAMTATLVSVSQAYGISGIDISDVFNNSFVP